MNGGREHHWHQTDWLDKVGGAGDIVWLGLGEWKDWASLSIEATGPSWAGVGDRISWWKAQWAVEPAMAY